MRQFGTSDDRWIAAYHRRGHRFAPQGHLNPPPMFGLRIPRLVFGAFDWGSPSGFKGGIECGWRYAWFEADGTVSLSNSPPP